MIKFSRSQQASARFCRRQMYLQYMMDGIGYVPVALSLPKELGILVHDITTSAVKATKDYGHPDDALINNLCENKVTHFRRMVSERGFDNEALSNDLDSICRIAVGLARGWLTYRLPQILKTHKILAVEQEWLIQLTTDISMEQRHDFVMERLCDKELSGLELKTTGIMTDTYLESWRYSQQMLSQLWGIQYYYGKIPLSVQVEFLYKGTRRADKSGKMVYYTPWTREYVDTEPPVEAIAGYFSYREIMRNGRDMDIWLRQTPYEVMSWHKDNYLGPDAQFPMRLDEQCYSGPYYSRCVYLDHCYGLVDDISKSERFMKRTPHHGEVND